MELLFGRLGDEGCAVKQFIAVLFFLPAWGAVCRILYELFMFGWNVLG